MHQLRVAVDVRSAWVRRRRIACFVDKRRGRAKRRQRRHQLQQLEIEAFAGRDAPAHVIASPHARHLVWTLGRNEAGKNSSFGMTVRAPPRRARPCPSMASAMDLRPEKIRCISTHRWTAALCQGKRQQLIAHVTPGFLQPPPHLPCERRDGEPRNRREDEGPGGRLHDHQPDHETESRQPETSERRSDGIERRGFLATPGSLQTRFLFAFPDMLFDEKVALAGKIAGKARNRPPKIGPKRAAMTPATTVIAPPRTR